VESLFELERAAIANPFVRIEHPHSTANDTRNQPELSLANHELEMQPGAWSKRTIRLYERAAGADVKYANETARAQCRARDVLGRRVISNIATTVFQGLTQEREPCSYLSTRVRPVAPSTRTAYCARAP
jgi:hypothetical protein